MKILAGVITTVFIITAGTLWWISADVVDFLSDVRRVATDVTNTGLTGHMTRVAVEDTSPGVAPAQNDGIPQLTAPPGGRTDPRDVTFTWEYAGRTYEVVLPMYGGLYRHYWQSPKVITYSGDEPPDWEQRYFRMFLQQVPDDDTIGMLATAIHDAGKKQKLTDNQVVELTVAFVQTISYDEPKARRITAGGDLTDGTLVYPYETLYQNTGVCSDKSVLLYTLLRALGYGAALLTYDDQQHMAVGVQCPQEYASYDSGYCYVETTTTMPIGMIPTLESGSNRAITPAVWRSGEGGVFDAIRALGTVQIFAPTMGETYSGIAQTIALVDEMNRITTTLATIGATLTQRYEHIVDKHTAIEKMTATMEKLKNKKRYDEYNAMIDDYNDKVKEYHGSVNRYDALREEYNRNVARYNDLAARL